MCQYLPEFVPSTLPHEVGLAPLQRHTAGALSEGSAGPWGAGSLHAVDGSSAKGTATFSIATDYLNVMGLQPKTLETGFPLVMISTAT